MLFGLRIAVNDHGLVRSVAVIGGCLSLSPCQKPDYPIRLTSLSWAGRETFL
jgi:hypothetical protein